MERIDRSFAGNLKRIRKGLNLSQNDLAKRADLHPAVISFYETGERKPGVEAIISLCRGLGCSPNDLITVDRRNTK